VSRKSGVRSSTPVNSKIVELGSAALGARSIVVSGGAELIDSTTSHSYSTASISCMDGMSSDSAYTSSMWSPMSSGSGKSVAPAKAGPTRNGDVHGKNPFGSRLSNRHM
jgi:hypothetical protein